MGGVWQECTRNEWTLSTPEMVIDVGVIGPFETGYLNELVSDRSFNLNVKGLKDIDVIMMLRLQLERMEGKLIPSTQEYFRCYGLNQVRLERAAPDAVVMHPGPMNRGLEIASDVADSERSLILSQVTNGIAVRMAIMAQLVGAEGVQTT